MRCIAITALLVLAAGVAVAKDPPKERSARDLAKLVDRALKKKDTERLKELSTPAFAKLLGTKQDPLVRLRAEGAKLEVARRELKVTGLRALLGLRVIRGGEALSEGEWFQLERSGLDWVLSGVVDPGAKAEAWLAAGLKDSPYATPEAAVQALVQAVHQQKREDARASTTEHGWNKPGDTLESLYRQAVRKRFVLEAKAFQTKSERSVAEVAVVRGGRVLDRVYLYLIKRQRGWLIDGIDEDEAHGARFLAKTDDAKPRPTSPSQLASEFVATTKLLSRVNCAALWTPDGWATRGAKLFRQRIASKQANFRQASDPIQKAQRAYAPIEQRYKEEVDLVFYLLLVRRPEGWRIDGWTKSKKQAVAFLTP